MEELLRQIQKTHIQLLSIESLADYLANFGPLYSYGEESDQCHWRELRDACLEFLEVVQKLVQQGLEEKRCLFILGY
ncbi:MAG: hypothetical protein H6510_00350 [Acidobacteria bacterium]|nr:hypothetical protein [Acidobacteriota bacterium]